MALERIYESAYSLQRLRHSPLSDLFEGFCEWLLGLGFALGSIRHHLARAYHLGEYVQKRGITDSTELTSKHIQAFLTDYLPTHKCPRGGREQRSKIAFSIHRFEEYLLFRQLINPEPRERPPYQSLCDDYMTWMKNYHHCAPSTVEGRHSPLRHFLQWLGPMATPNKLSALSADKLHAFFFEYADGRSRAQREAMTITLRTFCRFCVYRGYITLPLDQAVPSFRTYKLSTLPCTLTNEQVTQLLSSIDRTTTTGRRDYAVIQLLHTYGVRGGHVRMLRIDDVNWRGSQIRFPALKHGNEIVLPLLEHVGESLLSYLQRARPASSYPEVFLTVRAPYCPLRTSSALSRIIRSRMQNVGINIRTRGAHVFRHTLASQMLAQGQPLKSIADILGHRSLESTSIYAKVDFRALEQVTLEWPEEEQ